MCICQYWKLCRICLKITSIVVDLQQNLLILIQWFLLCIREWCNYGVPMKLRTCIVLFEDIYTKIPTYIISTCFHTIKRPIPFLHKCSQLLRNSDLYISFTVLICAYCTFLLPVTHLHFLNNGRTDSALTRFEHEWMSSCWKMPSELYQPGTFTGKLFH